MIVYSVGDFVEHLSDDDEMDDDELDDDELDDDIYPYDAHNPPVNLLSIIKNYCN